MQIPFDPHKPRMYSDLAWLWPIISPPEEYIAEALQFTDLIRRSHPTEAASDQIKSSATQPRPSLLHLGCGGGHLDHTLQKYFQLTCVDLSPQMLSLARKLNPQIGYHLGDMRSLQLGQLFEAVIVADSIDYMLTEADLGAAFLTAYNHLVPGGVFVTYAEQTLERFSGDQSDCSLHISGDLHVTLVENLFDPDPSDSTYDMTFLYLIRSISGERGLTLEVDHHLGGLFPEQTWCRLLAEVGFAVHQEEFAGEGFPIFIGLK